MCGRTLSPIHRAFAARALQRVRKGTRGRARARAWRVGRWVSSGSPWWAFWGFLRVFLGAGLVEMPVRIRLARAAGRIRRPIYRIRVQDSKAPRDGKFIEEIGTYYPVAESQRDVRLARRAGSRARRAGVPPPSVGMPRAADLSLPCAPAANRKDEGDAAGARAREILAVRRRAADGVCGALISRGELDAAPAQTRFQKGTHAGTAPARVQRAAIVLITLICVRSRFVAHADTTGGATSRGGGRGLV
eukprot:COSAG02_NODE_187_length_30377_cov_3.636271_23_plen_247_part_00